MSKFIKPIRNTIWNHGNIIINKKNDVGAFGDHDSEIEIYLGNGSKFIIGRLDRESTAPRIYITTKGIEWIHNNSQLGYFLTVEILGKNKIRIQTLETKKENW